MSTMPPKTRRLVERALRETRDRMAAGPAGAAGGPEGGDHSDVALIDAMLDDIAAAEAVPPAAPAADGSADEGGGEARGVDEEDGEEADGDEEEEEADSPVPTGAAKAALLAAMADFLEGRPSSWNRALSVEAVAWALLDADPVWDRRGMEYALAHAPYSTFRDDYAVGRYLSSLDHGLALAGKLGHPAHQLLSRALGNTGPGAAPAAVARALLALVLRAESVRAAG